MKKILKTVILILTGVAMGVAGAVKVLLGREKNLQKMSDKHLALFLMMNQWVKIKQEGKQIADYLGKNGYKTIAVYGLSYVGETLLEELKDTSVQVKYAIDKKAGKIYDNVDIVAPEDELEEVDAIIVTAVYFMDEIEEMLSSRVSCPILSLEEVLYDL